MNSTEKARLYWGDNLPDWIRILAEECDKTSQGKVAARIKYSKATISLVLKNDYKGTIAAVIRAVLMNSTHECPVFGEILTRDCLFNQAQPFSNSGNQNRIRLFRACRQCKFNRTKENADV